MKRVHRSVILAASVVIASTVAGCGDPGLLMTEIFLASRAPSLVWMSGFGTQAYSSELRLRTDTVVTTERDGEVLFLAAALHCEPRWLFAAHEEAYSVTTKDEIRLYRGTESRAQTIWTDQADAGIVDLELWYPDYYDGGAPQGQLVWATPSSIFLAKLSAIGDAGEVVGVTEFDYVTLGVGADHIVSIANNLQGDADNPNGRIYYRTESGDLDWVEVSDSSTGSTVTLPASSCTSIQQSGDVIYWIQDDGLAFDSIADLDSTPSPSVWIADAAPGQSTVTAFTVRETLVTSDELDLQDELYIYAAVVTDGFELHLYCEAPGDEPYLMTALDSGERALTFVEAQ